MEEKEDKPKTLYSAFKQQDVWVLTISEPQEVFPEVHRTFDGCREGVRKDLSAYYPDDVLEKLWIEVENGLESDQFWFNPDRKTRYDIACCKVYP